MLTAPQLILTAHLLNFNWRGTGHWSLVAGYCSLVTGYWLLETGCWLLERERLKAEGLTIGDSFDWGFQIADLGFIKRIEFLFYRE
jgi:hypothetical protein